MMIINIKNFFKGHKRTVKAKKNIIASFFIKGASIIFSFLIIKITLNYIDAESYGIWLTISSAFVWIGFFDVGLGNGLRNKLAEALAANDLVLGKKYVSTTYALLIIGVTVFAVVFFVVNLFINWNFLLNISKEKQESLNTLVLMVFGLFFVQFVLKLISSVLLAYQLPAISNLFAPLSNLLALIIIFILTKTTTGSLFILAMVLSTSPVVILLLASTYLYSNKFKDIAPSLYYIDFKYTKPLLSLGIKFFFIQLSALIIFQSSNFIISHFFGPKEVTSYTIAYKYYSIITMGFSIITAPFWSAITEAWEKNEIDWIKRTIRKLLYIWIGLLPVSILLFLFSKSFFILWLGKEAFVNLNISTTLEVLLLIYFLISTFGRVFNMFINGVGKIKIQTLSLLIGALMFIPINIFLIKFLNMGINSVVISTILSDFYSPFIAPLQFNKLINNTAWGIWSK